MKVDLDFYCNNISINGSLRETRVFADGVEVDDILEEIGIDNVLGEIDIDDIVYYLEGEGYEVNEKD